MIVIGDLQMQMKMKMEIQQITSELIRKLTLIYFTQRNYKIQNNTSKMVRKRNQIDNLKNSSHATMSTFRLYIYFIDKIKQNKKCEEKKNHFDCSCHLTYESVKIGQNQHSFFLSNILLSSQISIKSGVKYSKHNIIGVILSDLNLA